MIARIGLPLGSLLTVVGNSISRWIACGLLFSLASIFLCSCTEDSTPTTPNELPTVWRVAPDGSGDAPTIQAAIDSAETGDTVLLAPGTYTWASEQASGIYMVELKPGISLIGDMGRDVTILDGEEKGGILRCAGTGKLTLEGVTITRGKTGLRGAGLGADSVTVTLSDCTFRMNQSLAGGERGAALFCLSAIVRQCEFIDNAGGFDVSGGGISYVESLDIANSTFRNNLVFGDAGAHGGAIRAFGGTYATITRCTFIDNTAQGSFAASGGAIRIGAGVISECVFARNTARVETPFVDQQGRGGAIACAGCEISDCVFVENVAIGGGVPGFGGAVASTSLDTVTVDRCTLVGNRAETRGEISDPRLRPVGGIGALIGRVHATLIVDTIGLSVNSTTETQCSNFFNTSLGDTLRGVEMGGNFSQDPLFCNEDPPGALVFSLREDSPCAPGRHPDGLDCGLIGATPVCKSH